MKTRNYDRLRALFQLAVSLAAGRAYGCGTCPDASTTIVPLLPRGNGPDGGADGSAPLDCKAVCGSDTTSCKLADDEPGGTALVECTSPASCGAGRRHDGYEGERFSAADALGAYFAELALLERASVPAFRVFARELAAHGAPRSLVARARRAVADEIRHARATRRLALAHGARLPVARRPTTRPARSLRAIAEENAREGCVHETFGALVATAQARNATSPRLARLFARIARDETRHAALAHDAHVWMTAQLAPRDRRAVERTYARALSEAASTPVAENVAPATRALLGLPSPSETRALAEQLARSLRANIAS